MRYRCATPAQSEKKIIKALRTVNLIREFLGNPRLGHPSDPVLLE